MNESASQSDCSDQCGVPASRVQYRCGRDEQCGRCGEIALGISHCSQSHEETCSAALGSAMM